MTRLVFAILAFIAVDTSAAQPDAPKYVPAIRGELSNGKQPMASNVCLRQSGSEIRSCGYTDFEGRFQIPGSGSLHTAPAKVDASGTREYPIYWLEIGRVGAARKIGPVELVDAKGATLDLDCDLGRVADGERGFCRPKSAEPIAKSDAASRHRHAHGGSGGSPN